MNDSKEKTTIDLSNATNISDLGSKISSVLETDGATNKKIYLNLGDIDLKQSQLLSIKALIETMNSSLLGIQTKSEMTEASAIGLGLTVNNTVQEKTGFYGNNDDSENSENNSLNSKDEISTFAELKKLNSIGDFVTDTQSLPEVEDENIEEKTQEFLEEADTVSDNNNDNDDNDETVEELSQEAIDKIDDSDIFQTPEQETKQEIEPESESEQTNIYEEIEKEKQLSIPTEEIQSALDVALGINAEQKEEDYDIFAKPQQMQDKFGDYEVTETTERTDENKYILLDTEGITPEGIELIKSNTSDLPTLYLTQTLRSGQTVSYEGNIFIIGDTHPGSEVNATGDITVWGILGGIVHAGSKGNLDAKVRALKLNPIQLRIANLYSRRNDTINVPYVQKSNEFTPEEARIEKKQIVIYKTLRRED